ncbi:GMC family oxidoreductase N-terminal domain-containing protein [Capillimicrobium parvum]|uniref:GMC-type oxidoreductase n=1 Tax=Capillimicrobium parvum TaxID=2884022 RepID=A0A9E6XWF9_9ACTN|nr:GMC family oxidoreductase [Capillimicrobium parvum]UGS35690.1 putative GMC-type oxidoreductase [Capillimicrobium parvum]
MIVDAGEMAGRREIRADVVVVGTGAGGAPAAKELAEAGATVVMLEEGAHHPTDTLTARPRESLATLYRDGGQIATVGAPPIVLPLGRAVGGTTLVNSGTCFRTPPHVLERWRREIGLELDLEPCFERVEAELNVVEVPPELAGRNAAIVRRGAQALGVSSGYLRRNVRGCVGSGVCAYGCPAGAKQHTGATYVPKAHAAGAVTYTGVRVRRILVERGRAVGVEGRTAAGGRLRVRAGRVILAAGAVHTPVLLARNRLGGASGMLGRNLSIHPATAARARFDEDVVMWDGVPQSYHVDELASDGIMLEGIAGPPDYLAMAIPRIGPEHRELMLDARRLAQFGVMVCDTGRGRVHDLLGRPVIRYDLHREDAARFVRGLELLARIWFAAGAREVVVPVKGVPALHDGDTSPLHAARVRPRDLTLMAFHPLGTARAGADPERSVLDPELQVRGTPGLYVCDGSAVPTSLGVNPQITIMAMATRLAHRLACVPSRG